MTVAGVVLYLAHRSNRRAWMVSLLWSWFGLALGLAGVVAVLYLRGNLSAAYQAVVLFNFQFVGAGDWVQALGDWRRAVDALQPVQFATWLALLGLVAVWFGRRMGRFPRVLATSLLVWWLAEVLLALMGPSRSMRYWQAVWPPALMLAACGFRYLQMSYRRIGRGQRVGFVFVVVTALAVLLAPTWQHYKWALASSYTEYTNEVRERDHLRELGRRLQEVTPPGAPIYVHDYSTGVYLYADRPCVSRFTYPRSHEQMAETLVALEAGRAAAILIREGQGGLPEDYTSESAWARLEAVLADYELASPGAGDLGYELYLQRNR